MPGTLDALSILPGIAGAAMAPLQFGGELLSQLINVGTRFRVADEIRDASVGAAEGFRDDATGQLNKTEDLVREHARLEGLNFEGIDTMLSSAGGEAIDRYGGIVPEAKRMGSEAQRRMDAGVSELRMRVDADVSNLKTEGEAFFNTMAEKARSVVDGIRTNMTERAGGLVGGLRSDTKRKAQELEARLRAEGRMTEAEIQGEKNKILEGGNQQVSQVWGQAFTALSEQIAAAGVAGNNMLAEVGVYQVRAMTLARTEASRTLGAAFANRAELDLGVANMVSGTMEFVSEQTANIIQNTAASRAMNKTNRINYNNSVTQSLIALDSTRLSVAQYYRDTILNGEFQAGGIEAGTQVMMPNLVGMMQPGLSMITSGAGNIMNQPSGPKSGWSGQVLLVGGGKTCIDARALVETPVGPVPIGEIRCGEHVLGPDGKYHEVVNYDTGWVPLEAMHDYILVRFAAPDVDGDIVDSFLILTPDHTISGKKAITLRLGGKIRLSYGTGTITGLAMQPYLIGADLDLKGCSGYVVNGVVVDSMIHKMPPDVQGKIRSDMASLHGANLGG